MKYNTHRSQPTSGAERKRKRQVTYKPERTTKGLAQRLAPSSPRKVNTKLGTTKQTQVQSTKQDVTNTVLKPEVTK